MKFLSKATEKQVEALSFNDLVGHGQRESLRNGRTEEMVNSMPTDFCYAGHWFHYLGGDLYAMDVAGYFHRGDMLVNDSGTLTVIPGDEFSEKYTFAEHSGE